MKRRQTYSGWWTKKKKKKNKAAELEEDIEKLKQDSEKEKGKKRLDVLRRLANKKTELEEACKKLRSLKGNPVTLKRFLEEVVLPNCELCPP